MVLMFWYGLLMTLSISGLVFIGIRNERLQRERLIKDQLLMWQAANYRRSRGSRL